VRSSGLEAGIGAARRRPANEGPAAGGGGRGGAGRAGLLSGRQAGEPGSGGPVVTTGPSGPEGQGLAGCILVIKTTKPFGFRQLPPRKSSTV
jgi:hypothetical protein